MSTSRTAARPSRLLLERPRLPESLDHDARLRYAKAAELIAELCRGREGPLRVLEVGCNVLNLIPAHFEPGAVHVVRCDTFDGRPDDPDYVRIEPDGPLPFADGSFDVAVGLEVLEHLAPSRRREFLAECLRVASRGAVWSCPNGDPAVERAERIAAEAFRERNGYDHPFLSEHHEHGLPTEAEVREHLRSLDVPNAVYGQAPLPSWLAGILLGEALAEAGAAPPFHERLRELMSNVPEAAGAMPYRKVYVAAKTFDATGALNAEPDPEPDRTIDGAAVGRIAGQLVRATHEHLRQREQYWIRRERELEGRLDREREEWLRERESLFEDWHREYEQIDAHRRAALGAADAARRDVSAWHLRTRVLDELVRDLSASWGWKLLAPLRLLGRLLRPSRRAESRLIVWDDLRPKMDDDRERPEVSWQGHVAPPGVEWESCGDDPQLVLPGFFPPGWLRVRVELRGTAEAHADLFADHGDGFRADTRLDAFDWVDDLTVDVVFRVARPVYALRLDPLSGQQGSFQVVRFMAESLPPAHALMHAVRRKWTLLRSYHCLGRTLARGTAMLLAGRWRGAFAKVFQAFPDDRRLGPVQSVLRTSYDVWRKRHALDDEGRRRIADEIRSWENPPLISVLMPVYNGDLAFLERAIESVRSQLYPHWQLCVTDDASTDPKVRALLRRYAAKDARIQVRFAPANGGISAASNDALSRAEGSYVALLDHDDEYAEHALYRIAAAILANPRAEMIYSDEDKLDPEGRHIDPFFKPDWAPEYFLTCMYTCHLTVIRAELARSVGGFRSEFDFAQDYDLALRVVSHVQRTNRRADGTSAESERIVHVPDVLYHWRMAPTSTATGHEAKPQAEIAARRAVSSYLERMGRAGTVERGPSPGLQRVRFDVVGNPKVSVVIPTASRPAEIGGEQTYFLRHLIESLRARTTYANLEVIAVDNGDMPAELRREMGRHGVRCVSFTEPFNLAEKMNLGAREATGDYLILLNDDTEVITPGWVEAMLGYAQWPEIGAVGAKLLFANGNIQHAGVTFVGKYPFHHFYDQPGEHPGYWGGNILVRNYSCVTGACLMVRRSLYLELGGFDPAFPLNFNDVDFCLKVIDSGRRIVFQPDAKLYHFEGVSKDGCFVEEIERYLERHGDRWECDPMYNPHLTRTEYDYRIGNQ